MASESGPVQTIPRGLLGLLQLKNHGRNPQTLVDSYQPVIEFTEWFAESEPISATVTGTLNGGAGTGVESAGIFVPARELWMLRDVTLTVVMDGSATADIAQMAIGWRQPQGPVNLLCDLRDFTAANQDPSTARLRMQRERLLLLPPGTEMLVVYGYSVFKAPAPFAFEMRYTPALI